jgi:hypothetical protein
VRFLAFDADYDRHTLISLACGSLMAELRHAHHGDIG